MAGKSERKKPSMSRAKRPVRRKEIPRERIERRSGRRTPTRLFTVAVLLTVGIVMGYAMGASVQSPLPVLGGPLGDAAQRIETWSHNLFPPTRSQKEVNAVPSLPSSEPDGETESDSMADSMREEYSYPDEMSYGQTYGISEDQTSASEENSGESGESDVVESTYADDYDSASTGRYIDVDLGAQYAVLYDGSGNALWESPIVSGDVATGFGTPEGTYTIYDKELSTELVGLDYDGDGYPDYDNYVDYWMPFSGGLGLHDASWRESFGDNIYSYDGSHGCVNLPYDAAASLYDLVTVGETVVVHW